MQSPIANDFFKVEINCNSDKYIYPNLLLQVSVQELYNSTVSSLEEGGIKEAQDSYNNTIISYSTPRNILLPQFNNMNA